MWGTRGASALNCGSQREEKNGHFPEARGAGARLAFPGWLQGGSGNIPRSGQGRADEREREATGGRPRGVLAESTGSARNLPYPHAWRYRDYVIDAFNSDRPYDQFVREQIAGDLLPADSPQQRDEQLIATGFLALGV